MKPAFAMSAVICAACGVQAKFEEPQVLPSLEVIEGIATSILADAHIKERKLCTVPKMVVLHIDALIPDEMFVPVAEKAESPIIH